MFLHPIKVISEPNGKNYEFVPMELLRQMTNTTFSIGSAHEDLTRLCKVDMVTLLPLEFASKKSQVGYNH
jgi:RIO-like serine/threonine protein kinase